MPNAFYNPVYGRIIPFGVARKAGEEHLFRVTQTFDHVNEDIGPWKHGALDLGDSRCGDPIIAAASGKARTLIDSAGSISVIIDHGDGWISMYWHMAKWAIPKGKTTAVHAGDVLGYVGRTGLAKACHLHFELHYKGAKVDPWPHLVQNGAVNLREDDNVKIQGVFIEHIINKKTSIATKDHVGAWVHDTPSTNKESRLQLFKDATQMIPTVKVKGEVFSNTDVWYAGWAWIDAAGWRYAYYHESVVGPLVDAVVGGIDRAKYDADILSARHAGKKAVADAAVAEAQRP